jgi:alanine dehydrogenase
MIVGTVKEIEATENRSGIAGAVVGRLSANCHRPPGETESGVDSGFVEEVYAVARAELLAS